MQSWTICPRIREVDAVFRLAPGLQDSIRETHPELCFRLLNKGRPLENPKKSATGLRIRRELLRGWTANLDAALRQARRAYPARQAGLDDLLDAIAAAVVASLTAAGHAATVPLAPERDACGLAMEIVGA
jgi:predicted RNase H-like nuclease